MQFHFAPLQGYTDYDYRNTHATVYGPADTYYTPFVRLEKGREFRPKDLKDISPDNNHVPHIVPQLIAGTHDEAAAIIDMMHDMGYHEIDINMGCPHRLMVIKGKGAAILAQPARVADVLRVTDEYPDITFTLKMRTGMDSHDECLALAPVINAHRLAHVTVHPRTGRQQYTGRADRDAFARFASACDKPLVYNGDIATCADIDAVIARFPQLAGIMIGRGLLANPALISEWKTGTETDPKARRTALRKFHGTLLAAYRERMQGEAQILAHLKPHWEYLYPELDKHLRKQITKAGRLTAYIRAVEEALR